MAQCTFGTRIPLLQSDFSAPLSGTRFEMYEVLAKLFTIRSVSHSRPCGVLSPAGPRGGLGVPQKA